MTIVVIDDNAGEVARLTDVLEEAYPNAEIFPPKSLHPPRAFAAWPEVLTYLETITDDLVVLCLDLALGEADYHNILRGLEKGRTIRALRPGWVLRGDN